MIEKIAKIIADYRDCDVAGINSGSTFDSLGLDSLETVEIITAIEDEFSVEIELDGSIKTVGDLVDTVEKLINL